MNDDDRISKDGTARFMILVGLAGLLIDRIFDPERSLEVFITSITLIGGALGVLPWPKRLHS